MPQKNVPWVNGPSQGINGGLDFNVFSQIQMSKLKQALITDSKKMRLLNFSIQDIYSKANLYTFKPDINNSSTAACHTMIMDTNHEHVNKLYSFPINNINVKGQTKLLIEIEWELNLHVEKV